MSTEDECKVAISQFGLNYEGLTKKTNSPIGCYWHSKGGSFNKIINHSATEFGITEGGVCRKKGIFMIQAFLPIVPLNR